VERGSKSYPYLHRIFIIGIYLAIIGRTFFYWIAALGIYIFSFIAGFSIGQWTVGFTFVPLALAIGHSTGWIKRKTHRMIFLSSGVIIGCLLVLFVDDGSLFYPFWFFMNR